MAFATVNEALRESDRLAQEMCNGVAHLLKALEVIVSSRGRDDGLKETLAHLSGEVNYLVFDAMNSINCAAEQFGCKYSGENEVQHV